jgi:acyl-CoA thioester hydrolase
MHVTTCEIRVRYGEVDPMGYVYYGNYALYLEQGRTDSLRQVGLTYRELEENNIIMPVLEVKMKYILPARYDDVLTVRTILENLPTTRITFKGEISNSENLLINLSETTLVFVNRKTMRPCSPPEYLLQRFRPVFTTKD